MPQHQVLIFTPYPFQEGQRIRIEEGPRRGDWLVIGQSERKVRLKCPVSGREVEWDRFYQMVETRTQEWPQHG